MSSRRKRRREMERKVSNWLKRVRANPVRWAFHLAKTVAAVKGVQKTRVVFCPQCGKVRAQYYGIKKGNKTPAWYCVWDATLQGAHRVKENDRDLEHYTLNPNWEKNDPDPRTRLR